MQEFLTPHHLTLVCDRVTAFFQSLQKQRSRLEKKPTINSWTRHVVWLGVKLREEPLKIWTHYNE